MVDLRARLVLSDDGSPALYLFSADGNRHAVIKRAGGDTVLSLSDDVASSAMIVTLAEGEADFRFPSAMLAAFLDPGADRMRAALERIGHGTGTSREQCPVCYAAVQECRPACVGYVARAATGERSDGR